jgi:hypothetical protein
VFRSNSHRLRSVRNYVAWTILLCASPLVHSAGQYFEALRQGQFTSFDSQSAYRIRVYVQGLFASYEKRCPDEAPNYRIPWDLVAYGLKPVNSAWGTGGSVFSLELAARDTAFFTLADAERDMASVVSASSCALSVHRGWIDQAKKVLSEPRLAGPLSGLQQACEAAGQHNAGCVCFDEAYDMQSSPAQRRRFLEAQTPLQGFQQTLHDADFATRVAIKCPSTPNFFAAAIVEKAPAHANEPDDAHRLREGEYDIKPLRAADRRMHGTYLVRRTGNWRYEFKFLGRGGNHIGYLSNDGKQLTLYVGMPLPRTFEINDDGTMRTLDGENRFDLVHSSARASKLPVPRVPEQGPAPKANPQQCARLRSDIERFRANPRGANTLAILEKRYADWCTDR